jgi:hypothetical protein
VLEPRHAGQFASSADRYKLARVFSLLVLFADGPESRLSVRTKVCHRILSRGTVHALFLGPLAGGSASSFRK